MIKLPIMRANKDKEKKFKVSRKTRAIAGPPAHCDGVGMEEIVEGTVGALHVLPRKFTIERSSAPCMSSPSSYSCSTLRRVYYSTGYRKLRKYL